LTARAPEELWPDTTSGSNAIHANRHVIRTTLIEKDMLKFFADIEYAMMRL
jgi:hypothetical protein